MVSTVLAVLDGNRDIVVKLDHSKGSSRSRRSPVGIRSCLILTWRLQKVWLHDWLTTSFCFALLLNYYKFSHLKFHSNRFWQKCTLGWHWTQNRFSLSKTLFSKHFCSSVIMIFNNKFNSNVGKWSELPVIENEISHYMQSVVTKLSQFF